jgi:hypothetical protein
VAVIGSFRTIILLSAKRTGSTALFRMFQRHPEVGVCHVDSAIDNWEPNFWNLAASAIAGDPQPFIDRFRQSHPFLTIRSPVDEEQVFALWDEILERHGPIVFDKSPQYLGNRPALDLLRRHMARGNDVRLFALIRDPRDAIASQYSNWGHLVDNDSPEGREEDWLRKYEHLEELQRTLGPIPLFRYEDLAAAPQCYAPMIFHHVGVRVEPATWEGIRPVNVGRHRRSRPSALRRWEHTERFREHLLRYGYFLPPKPPVPLRTRVRRLARRLRGIARGGW